MARIDAPPNVMTDLVALLTELDDFRSLDHIRAISVSKVLAWSWSPGRLQDCAQRLAAGGKAPPIHVNRYWLHGQAYYNVSDGRHRTVAARDAGRQYIRARISGENWCKPTEYVLMNGHLWRKNGAWLKQIYPNVANELAELLVSVGVTKA